MNGIVKAAFKVSFLKLLASPMRNSANNQLYTRSLWNMCNLRSVSDGNNSLLIQKPTFTCSCGCGIQRLHTKGERELVEFLSEEIVAERKAQKVKNIPANVDGFKVKLDGAEVTLTKQNDIECINVCFNVNHTVDAEGDAHVDPDQTKPDFAEMKSRPTFEVDIIRGGRTLSFTCSFMQEPESTGQTGSYNDVFGIDEVTIYEGEWNDKTYAVAGDVLDGYLYDLLMNLLEEKGITNEFVEKVADFSTVYEHSAYVGLLEGLSKFTAGTSAPAAK